MKFNVHGFYLGMMLVLITYLAIDARDIHNLKAQLSEAKPAVVGKLNNAYCEVPDYLRDGTAQLPISCVLNRKLEVKK